MPDCDDAYDTFSNFWGERLLPGSSLSRVGAASVPKAVSWSGANAQANPNRLRIRFRLHPNIRLQGLLIGNSSVALAAVSPMIRLPIVSTPSNDPLRLPIPRRSSEPGRP